MIEMVEDTDVKESHRIYVEKLVESLDKEKGYIKEAVEKCDINMLGMYHEAFLHTYDGIWDAIREGEQQEMFEQKKHIGSVERKEFEEESEPRKSIIHKSDELLDEQQTLEKIITEATLTKKCPAIVRMVGRHMGNKKESVETLAEALRLADIPVSQRKLILKNWAAHLDRNNRP